jgi:large subunit ribosomal protein L15
MRIHELKRRIKNKKHVLIGRGGKRGKTSGRGGKGQTARAGHKARPEMRDIIKRMPKLRGYSFKTIEKKPIVLNLADLELTFSNGDVVNSKTLVAKGLVKITGGRKPRVKILSMGEITKKVAVSGCLVSAGAKAKIEKAGGSVK